MGSALLLRGDNTGRRGEETRVAGLSGTAEAETILQLLGTAGLARFFAARLLFAKDRAATLAAVRCAYGSGGGERLGTG